MSRGDAVIDAIEAIVAREVAVALETAASDPALRLSGHSGVSVRALRERAAEIKGA